jgi:hypothetical protein
MPIPADDRRQQEDELRHGIAEHPVFDAVQHSGQAQGEAGEPGDDLSQPGRARRRGGRRSHQGQQFGSRESRSHEDAPEFSLRQDRIDCEPVFIRLAISSF